MINNNSRLFFNMIYISPMACFDCVSDCCAHKVDMVNISVVCVCVNYCWVNNFAVSFLIDAGMDY